MRIVIIGNSGSGKTWLAARLGERTGIDVVHLDDIFWQPGGFEQKRPPDEVARLIEARRMEANWIAEGVYGDLAGPLLQFADTLLWLDIPWSVCKQRIESRGSDGSGQLGRKQSERSLRDLVIWAEAYYSRGGSCSEAAHLEIFNAFPHRRYRLRSEERVREYLNAT